MVKTGAIVDKAGNPIKGSSIVFKNGAAVLLSMVLPDGQFSFDTDTDSGLFAADIDATFSAPGYNNYTISSITIPDSFLVTITKKPPVALYVGAGVGLGLLLVAAKKGKRISGIKPETINTVLIVGAGVIGFTLVKQLLEKSGIWKSAATKAIDELAQTSGNFWDPNYWQTGNGSFTSPLSEDDAIALLAQIKSAFGILTDNREQVIAVFKSLKSKANVSFLAWEFQKQDQSDLLTFIRTGGGILPWDGLSDADVLAITNYINTLPNY